MAAFKIGFLGFGQMASAMAAGIAKSDIVAQPADIFAYDIWAGAMDNAKSLGYTPCASNMDVVSKVDVIVVAVKPQVVADVLKEIGGASRIPLVVSIVAGLEIATIESYIGSAARVCRVMPNTPCMVQMSASGYTPNGHCTVNDLELMDKLLNSVGICIMVKEDLLHAVTAVSGSGPAYIYMAIDAMAEGGVKYGLTRQQAVQLAAQTALGSAEMVLKNPNTHIMQLKDLVSSPGGTTIAATATLREKGMPHAFHAAVDTCYNRSKELAEMSRQK